MLLYDYEYPQWGKTDHPAHYDWIQPMKRSPIDMKKIGIVGLIVSFCILVFAPLHAGDDASSPAASSGPGTVRLESISNLYEPVSFDHEMHTEIAENCSQCHHEHPSAEQSNCRDCHTLSASDFKKSATSSFTACQECHGDFDSSEPNFPGLKAAYHRTCFKCHREMGDVAVDPSGCTQKCHAKKKG
jgi:hypothetical protein